MTLNTTENVTPDSLVMSSSRVRLRPYQQAACKAVFQAFKKGLRRGMICIPTGGGKTLTAASFLTPMVKKFNGNVLWIAHRRELLEQAKKAFARVDPTIRVTMWNANEKDDSGDIVLAMIGSTRTLKRQFLIVVVDEAHHLAEEDESSEYSNMYNRVLKQVGWSHSLGLTATPDRLDGRRLDFDEIVYSIRFLDLVKNRRLAAPIYVEMLTKDKYDLQVRGGEFTAKSLQKLDNPQRNGKIASTWADNKDRYGKALMFVTGVEHCTNMKNALLQADPTADVRILTGADTATDRADTIRWFAEGSPSTPKVLVNCEVATEGFDEPSIKSVFLARPTMSKNLWLQMVGRGARNYEQDFHISLSDIVKREPVGNDGIEKFTFTNGAEYYGEDFGPIPDVTPPTHHLRLQMDTEFYLVSIMDDISKFHALVEEWQLDIRDLTPEEQAAQVESSILQQRKLSLQIVAKEETENAQEIAALGDAKIRDLVGVLVVSTYFHKKFGIPCDMERQAVLKRLFDFANECLSITEAPVQETQPDGTILTVLKPIANFDSDRYKDAYAFCISKAEFPPSVFEIIRVAFYFRFIQSRWSVRNREDGQNYETWKYIPLVEITPESRRQHTELALREAEEARRLNTEFNNNFGSPEASQVLIHQVKEKMREIVQQTKNPKLTSLTVKALWPQLVIVKVADRKISFFANVEVREGREMARIAIVARIASKALQEVLDDPNCIVSIRPRKVLFDRTGEAVS